MTNHVYATTPARTLPALEWSKTLCDGSTVDHASAVAACAELGDGWRLPTITEQFSLVDHNRSCPAIDITNFADTQSEWYWSSTAYSREIAWAVDFSDGTTLLLFRYREVACVRAVREVTK